MLSTRRRIIAAKHETTPGETESIDSADVSFFAYDGDIANQVDFTGRNAAGTLSQLPAQPGIENGQHTFITELYELPPWASILMPALGFKLDGSTWSPSDDPDDWEWLTSAQNLAGKLKRITGALGTATINLVAGQVPTVNWSFQGRYAAESDAAQWTPDFDIGEQHAGVRLADATATLGGDAIGFANAQIQIQNQVSLLLNVNAPGGIEKAWIESREITLQIDPLEELVANRNDDDAQRNKVLQAFEIEFDGVEIAMPRGQLRQIANNDRNGLSARQLTFTGTLDSVAGNDEFTIDFGTDT